jgi:glycerophosphoryl diester phosphodiesterase
MGRKTKVALTVGAASIAAWAASKVIARPVPRAGKIALDFDKTVILAHRGGSLEAPENTTIAFSKSAELGVHGFVVDIRLTKDEEIIVFHDEYVDAKTDLTGKVSEFIFSDLQKTDAGYHYQDENDEFIYRGKGAKLLSLRELLNLYPHLLISIHLKDSPDTYEGSLMPSKLWRLIEELGVEDRIVVTSQYDEQIDRFNLYAQERVATAAGNDEVKKAYAAFTSKFGHLYTPGIDCFMIPEKIGVFQLGSRRFIQFLSNLNIPTYYESVNDRDTMLRLMKHGAAGFITERPSLAMEVLQQKSED